MKYSSTNQPLVCMMTQSTCYRETTKITPLGVLWHSTGANNPNLCRYVQPDDNAANREEMIALLGKNRYNNDWNHIEVRAGLNAWIGKLADGTVTSVQTLPWNYSPWGCGKGSKGTCNHGWMQFEICEDGLDNKEYFDAVYKEACELTAYYCKMYNLDPKGTVQFKGVTVPTILCHYDSYFLKLGSNHGDVTHWFKRYGKTMEDVRNDVAALIAADEPQKPQNSVGEIGEGDIVTLAKEAVYYDNGKDVPDWVVAKAWIVKSRSGDRVVIDKSEDGQNSINSPIHVKYLSLKNQPVQEPAPAPAPEPEPAPAPTQTNSTPTLRKGDKGDAVSKLQTELKRLGFDCEGIDGSFGARTDKQVRAFQAERGLVVDGVCGPKTWNAIYAFAQYTVQVTVGILNIRSGPSSSNYPVIGTTTKPKQYTIVYAKGNWGKLANGAGWFYLPYTKKI